MSTIKGIVIFIVVIVLLSLASTASYKDEIDTEKVYCENVRDFNDDVASGISKHNARGHPASSPERRDRCLDKSLGKQHG